MLQLELAFSARRDAAGHAAAILAEPLALVAEKRSPAQATVAREQRRLIEAVERALADGFVALNEVTEERPDPIAVVARGRVTADPKPKPDPPLVVQGGRASTATE